MNVARRTLITLAVAAVGLPAGSASAQDGVVVDPSSPSGKEYAIPLDAARRDAAPGGQNSGGDSQSAPLFGEGVGDTQAESSTPAGTKPTSDDEKSQRRSRRLGTATPEVSTAEPTLRPSRPVAAALPDGDASSTLTVAAVALSVLLLGGVIGSIARRRGIFRCGVVCG